MLNLRPTLSLVIFASCFLASIPPLNAQTKHPNIIYVLADDMGYGDLGCYGSQKNKTPNIDALARNGVRLTDFHASAWCAPSRRGLMTGCHPNRPWGKKSERLAEAITIPEMLKTSGYATALIGKWHLGMGNGLHPLDQGFDYWCGTRGSNDWDGPRPNLSNFREAAEEAWKTPLHINRTNKGPVVKQSEFIGRYTQETIRFIEEQKSRPFFIYLAHNMPHVPIFASESFRGHGENGVYGDVVEELDGSVGEIVKTLEKLDLLENTIIVFTSDNGPWTMFGEQAGLATPLRGEKSTTWEGGDRVPCIVSWPEKINPSVKAGLITQYDMYATIAKLTNSSVKEGHAIDSIDMSGVLLSKEESKRVRHIHFFHQPMAFRSGDFKIHFFTRGRTRHPETGKQEPSVPQDPPLLFDLNNDLAEQKNVANKYPQLVEQLTTESQQMIQSLKDWKPCEWAAFPLPQTARDKNAAQ